MWDFVTLQGVMSQRVLNVISLCYFVNLSHIVVEILCFVHEPHLRCERWKENQAFKNKERENLTICENR